MSKKDINKTKIDITKSVAVTPKVDSFTRLNYETTLCYFREIKNNLELAVDTLEKEVKVLQEVLPDSESYWTMSSRLADAKSVYNDLDEFLLPYIGMS